MPWRPSRGSRPRNVSRAIAVLVTGLLFNLPISLLTNWASEHPEQLPESLRFVADRPWLPLLAVSVVAVGCSALAAFRPDADPAGSPSPQLSSLRRLVLQRMSQQLEDILPQGRDAPPSLDLGLTPLVGLVGRERPSFVGRSWTSADVVDAFDSSGRALLVVGEPGGGKTRLLCELAAALLERARGDESEPVPVLLNVTSWRKHQEFDDWLVREASDLYSIPRRDVRLLLDTRSVALLLDGLDESVDPGRCVDAVNDLRRTFGHDVAVGCRLVEYRDLVQVQRRQLALGGTVRIERPTTAMVRGYLAGTDVSERVVQQILRTGDSAMSPLSLTLLVRTSARSGHGLLSTAVDDRPSEILQAYVSSRIRQRYDGGVRSDKESRRILRYLTRLATAMEAAGVTITNNVHDWIRPSRQAPFAVVLLVSIFAYTLFIVTVFLGTVGYVVSIVAGELSDLSFRPPVVVAVLLVLVANGLLLRVSNQETLPFVVGSATAFTTILGAAVLSLSGRVPHTAVCVVLALLLAVYTWLNHIPLVFLRANRWLERSVATAENSADGAITGAAAVGAFLLPLAGSIPGLPWLVVLIAAVAASILVFGPPVLCTMLLNPLFLWRDAPLRTQSFIVMCAREGLVRDPHSSTRFQFIHPTVQRYFAADADSP